MADETDRVTTCRNCGRNNRVPAVGEGRPRCGNCGAELPWIADAGDQDFAEIAEQAEPIALVDLWAAWCGPCRKVSPALEEVAGQMAGQVKLVKVDIDAAPRLAQRFDVHAVPTLLLLDHGEVIGRQAGAAPAAALRQWVEETIASRRGARATAHG
ncbi:thiol reductase thioredoxin [Streptomyces sulfonofaciens]|uniref:Thioredoxin n=1 Tax=Streptomyces sulfonofaciens TaxID=68272 RepID=A0A919GHI3_9ACTN|nr:thioredoxin [Streptomyces sulfonofaciens]GHH84845.1 thiol reductase thioredoxin [Streptomyces sulfonofaciens]